MTTENTTETLNETIRATLSEPAPAKVFRPTGAQIKTFQRLVKAKIQTLQREYARCARQPLAMTDAQAEAQVAPIRKAADLLVSLATLPNTRTVLTDLSTAVDAMIQAKRDVARGNDVYLPNIGLGNLSDALRALTKVTSVRVYNPSPVGGPFAPPRLAGDTEVFISATLCSDDDARAAEYRARRRRLEALIEKSDRLSLIGGDWDSLVAEMDAI